jgi:hypothetical protein
VALGYYPGSPEPTASFLRWFRDTIWLERWRRYSLSWSRSLAAAKGFARMMRTCKGGSVVLETVAPPEAIISVLPYHVNHGEREGLVDRRRLAGVWVLALRSGYVAGLRSGCS